MRTIFILILVTISFTCFAQQQEIIKDDTILIIHNKPEKGFYSDYVVFIPRKTVLDKKIMLLVEPNNTGKLSDSIEVHIAAAIHLASVSSVGNSVARELKIPLLVPVFTRPASQPLLYTHALDRDVMTEKTTKLKRLDLQLLAMIEDARSILNSLHILTDEKVFMNGFSASATFTNRFSFMHPGKIKALAIGGFNGELILPQKEMNGAKLDYPIGINDFEKLFNQSFDLAAYKQVSQFIYMGKEDENDAVQFDDAYSRKERKIINENIGRYVQERFSKCQEIYKNNSITPLFKTFDNTGHWTTREMNMEVARFFMKYME